MSLQINVCGQERTILVMSENGGWESGLSNCQTVTNGGNVATDFSKPPLLIGRIGTCKLYYRQFLLEPYAVSRIYYYQPDNELTLYRVDGLQDPTIPAYYDYASFFNQYVTAGQALFPSDMGLCFVIRSTSPWSDELTFDNLYCYFYNASVSVKDLTTKRNNIRYNPFDSSVVGNYCHETNNLAQYAQDANLLTYVWNIADDAASSNYALGHALVACGAVSGTHKAFMDWLAGIDKDENAPFDGGGNSDDGGGIGNWDTTGEELEGTGLPTLSALDSGFMTAFNPTPEQLKRLATYMWTNDLFNPDTYKRIMANPMDAIIGLSVVPVTPEIGRFAEVNVGNLATDIVLPKVTAQYYEIDCGTITVSSYSGSYLDYDPYSKIDIYLPFCGIHPLRCDDVVGRKINLKYKIDIVSGGCVAEIRTIPTDNPDEKTKILYTFIGSCSSSIPITGSDMVNVVNGVLGIAGSIGTMAAGVAAANPAMIAGGAAMGVSAASNTKPSIERSGALAGIGGMMANRQPYIIYTKPHLCTPKDKDAFTGYQSYTTRKLSECSGYTEVESIHIDGVSATDDEKEMLETILKTGVII